MAKNFKRIINPSPPYNNCSLPEERLQYVGPDYADSPRLDVPKFAENVWNAIGVW